MISEKTRNIARTYTERHLAGWGLRKDKPYGNYGFWIRNGMTLEEAQDAMTEAVAEAAGMRAGDRVLEVGCGYGASAVHYANRFRPASVLGIDVTEVRIEQARDYIALQGLSDTIAVQVGDAVRLDFEAGSFDRVLAIECALHFNTRGDFLREAARVLKPGGGLGLADIVLRSGADRDSYIKGVHFPVGSDGSLDVPENVYDMDVYAELLEQSGFENLHIESITDRTVPPLIALLDRLANEATDERGPRRRMAAAIYREYLRLGMEYVLVSARRSIG